MQSLLPHDPLLQHVSTFLHDFFVPLYHHQILPYIQNQPTSRKHLMGSIYSELSEEPLGAVVGCMMDFGG